MNPKDSQEKAPPSFIGAEPPDTKDQTVQPGFGASGPEFVFDSGTHTYSVNGIIWPSPTSLFKEFGLINEQNFTQFHADKGRAAHLCCYLDDLNDLDIESVDAMLLPHLQAYRKFKQEAGFVPISELSEKPIVSRAFFFGTTPDMVGNIGNLRVLVELKTGSNFPWTTRIQTAFQEIALKEAGYPIFRRIGVHLKTNGNYSSKEFSDYHDREDAVTLVNAHWIRRHNK